MELEKDPKFVNIQILLAKSMIYIADLNYATFSWTNSIKYVTSKVLVLSSKNSSIRGFICGVHWLLKDPSIVLT